MKNVISLLLFVVLMFCPYPVFAVPATGCTDIGMVEVDSKIYLNSAQNKCSQISINYENFWGLSFLWTSPPCAFLWIGCDDTSGNHSEDRVPAMTIAVCCSDKTARDTVGATGYEKSLLDNALVTGVPLGGEKQAAEDYCTDLFTNPAYPYPDPDAGYIRTDGLAGYAYDATMSGSSNTQVDVSVVCWKRGGYTKSGGNVIPLEDIGTGGGGGGTSIDYVQLKASVQGAIDDATGVSDIKALLTDIKTNTESGTGGGLTADQMRFAVSGGVGDAIGTASGSVPAFSGVTPSIDPLSSYSTPAAYTNDRLPLLDSINFTQRVSDFYTDMKNAPLFSSLSLSPLSDVGSGTSSMPVSFGSFGTVNFDLANYAGTYNYIKGFLLLLGSYIALRVIILRR